MSKQKLWMYWEGSRSPYLDLCIESVQRHCSKDFDVVLVTPNNLEHWLPGHDLENFHWVAPSTKADYYRIALLVRHGGIWVDADVVMLKSFRDVLTCVPEKLTCVRKVTGGDSHVMMGFLAAPPDCALLSEVLRRQKWVIDMGVRDRRKLEQWGCLGSKILTQVIDESVNMHVNVDQRLVAPIDWRESSSFFEEKPLVLSPETICVLLFNSRFPPALHRKSRAEILGGSDLLGQLFRKSLLDSPLPSDWERPANDAGENA